MNIPELFGSKVFNDAAMYKYLSKDMYAALCRVINGGERLQLPVANAAADAMRAWAMAQGVTHYTHWFHPMTGVTAEKHDSFLSPTSGGKVIMEFSGKELVKGEPDASSFPSGGLRATFEARGYTAWDPTSYAFIKNDTLCIPTAFSAYSGQALDKKTPLLRSMQAIDKQAKRILKLFGNETVARVIPMMGAEQEYFLIDRDQYLKRPDLVHCGRTLFGAPPSKGQDLDDYYYGALKPRVLAFMKEAETELWELGVYAKTRHNEAAPAQHELACVYNTANVATDHNQLTMEVLRHVAARHNLACLLHEKPFMGVNGSGKHHNWSLLATHPEINLLEPGGTPQDNAQFLLFLAAVIAAVDEYQDLLRLTVATAGNDHRLGESEAPPAIVSIFLGDELTAILEAIETGTDYQGSGPIQMEIGVKALARIPRDVTDRNRTSPFAFTGNKFEFRMPGSSLSAAGPCFVLNTIVADALSRFADILEPSQNFLADAQALVRDTMAKHKRIVMNGNNYTRAWEAEAAARGLSHLPSAADALPRFIDAKNIDVLVRHKVLSEQEIRSRYEILLENYVKHVRIEALTMLDMARKDILPGVAAYQDLLTRLAVSKKDLMYVSADMEEQLLRRLGKASGQTLQAIDQLDAACQTAHEAPTTAARLELEARHMRDIVIPRMKDLRRLADEMEKHTGRGYWPMPSYAALLYSVN